MSRSSLLTPAIRSIVPATLILAVVSTLAYAGHQVFRQNSVGGIAISPEGVVSKTTVAFQEGLREQMQRTVKKAPAAIDQTNELRKISLRGLEAAVADAIENNLGVLPDEVKYLAGIQRIEYVLVYPDQQDIVLAGRGEGWTVNETGVVVGRTTGRPVIHIDDLFVALRTVDQARRVGISCSIDPTPEGLRNMQTYLKKQKRFAPAVLAGVEKSLGPQRVTVTGVPPTSHFARVMVASDFRMKMIAMKLTESPLQDLPSYLDLIKTAKAAQSNMMPRWWLACNYQPLAHSEDGLAWQLRGAGVKVMTEDDFVGDDGAVKGTGQKSPLAQQWAQRMTEVYDQLSQKDLVFGQLRNAMDLCVVAAVICKQDLLTRAGCELPLLTSPDSAMMLESWNPPKNVATQCSFVKRGRDYIITASGGVQINSWEVASKAEVSEKTDATRGKATAAAGSAWWWN